MMAVEPRGKAPVAPMPRTIMMFCGQGAQYYQMGRDVYQTNPVFRRQMDRCDEIAGDIGGRRVSEIIFSRPLSDSEHFDRVCETNPALLAIGWSLAMVLFERGVLVERLLGYSLGETIAAVVAGVLPLEEGFRLVMGQAERVEAEAPAGAMVAVLAAPECVAPLVAGIGSAEITAINTPSHCVVSLLAHDVPALGAVLSGAAVTFARLPVRHPYHGTAIERLGVPLNAFYATFQFAAPRWPIVSATTANTVPRFDGAHLWHVLRGPLQFRDTLEALAREGEWALIEAGPSGTLAAFARQMRAANLKPWPAIDQFGQNTQTIQRLVTAVT